MNNEESRLTDSADLSEVHNFQPYTYHRIVKILKDGNLYLDPIIWYKCRRIRNYRRHYDVREVATKRIVRANVSLDDLREILSHLGYPLKETEQVIRKQDTKGFIEAVENYKKEG